MHQGVEELIEQASKLRVEPAQPLTLVEGAAGFAVCPVGFPSCFSPVFLHWAAPPPPLWNSHVCSMYVGSRQFALLVYRDSLERFP